MIVDFTSAAFLGFRHSHGELAPWECLTTGTPAALDPARERVAALHAAQLMGVNDALVRRSSLHALIDIFGALAATDGTIALDDGAYPILEWAAGAISTRGVRVQTYRHHDHDHAASIARHANRPVVVATDGWCASCGAPAPLRELDELARRGRARVVVDDSLAFGVLGPRTDGGPAFGSGGTGTAGWLGLDHHHLINVASLAKAYGVPVTAVTGPPAVMKLVRRNSSTNIHASGPTAADRAALLAAATADQHALDTQRRRLGRLTRQLRLVLRSHGLHPIGLPFPFVLARSHVDSVALARELRRRGCRVLTIEGRCQRSPSDSLLGCAVRSDHSFASIDAFDRDLTRALGMMTEANVA